LDQSPVKLDPLSKRRKAQKNAEAGDVTVNRELREHHE
jgi:hypothetical protein